MNAQDIRKAYLEFFAKRGHVVIPRARLVPDNDPTTLFTGSGMQPLLPYLLGEKHPKGVRLVDSQTCLRAQDIEEVGDNRHTTFFEMLGNWSLGDYFKAEQLPWFWEFLTNVVGLDRKSSMSLHSSAMMRRVYHVTPNLPRFGRSFLPTKVLKRKQSQLALKPTVPQKACRAAVFSSMTPVKTGGAVPVKLATCQ